jgi:crossover junction endodeoxyribonuclease RuvC
MVRILGIDPALRKTGWGIIENNNNNLSFIACGSICTNKDDSISKRLGDLYIGISNIIDQYHLDEIAIEETFVNKNAVSSLKLGHARGALIVSCAIFKFEVYEYASTTIKKAIVGVGRADKNQIAQMVKLILPKSKFNNEDESDALAIAICHNNYRRF